MLGGLLGCAQSPATNQATNPASLPPGDRVRVDRVVDGDTIVADGVRIRLIGIDAPESVKPDSPVECYGPESAAALEALLPRGTSVLLEYDREHTDRFGRTLAYLWRTQPVTFVNEVLVDQGFATTLTIPPNDRHAAELAAAQDRARSVPRGLWRECPAP